MSFDRDLDKEDVVHIYNGILLSYKKEWNNAICSNMDGSRNYHTKWQKAERQILYEITYVWNLKYDTNELIYKTKTTSKHGKQTYSYQRGKGAGDKLGVWDQHIHTAIHKTGNKVLL